MSIAFIFLVIFGWFISSLIIWLVAKTLGGKATFRDTQGIVGYSLGPLITASIIVNVLITFLGPGLGSVITLDAPWMGYSPFEILYIPFIALTVYHCGNGIRTAHLLNEYYSYGISGALALFYVLFFLLPNIFVA